MRFQDNVLKEYLKNVYFICGTPCGGKTTVSRELGRRYGIAVYSADDEFSRHQKLSDARFQPSAGSSQVTSTMVPPWISMYSLLRM